MSATDKASNLPIQRQAYVLRVRDSSIRARCLKVLLLQGIHRANALCLSLHPRTLLDLDTHTLDRR